MAWGGGAWVGGGGEEAAAAAGSEGGARQRERSEGRGRKEGQRAWRAGRMVLAVVQVAPETMPSASPARTIMVAAGWVGVGGGGEGCVSG